MASDNPITALVEVQSDFRILPLTKGYAAIIDAEDYPRVKDHKWKYLTGGNGGGGYAARNKKVDGKWTTILLHRLIMNAPSGSEVDHRNGNRIDCRKRNLRITDRFGNQKNQTKQKRGTSKYKGVTRYNGKWMAQINPGKHINLGVYKTEEGAATAYDEAARFYFGEFAAVNFPKPGERCALRTT